MVVDGMRPGASGVAGDEPVVAAGSGGRRGLRQWQITAAFFTIAVATTLIGVALILGGGSSERGERPETSGGVLLFTNATVPVDVEVTLVIQQYLTTTSSDSSGSLMATMRFPSPPPERFDWAITFTGSMALEFQCSDSRIFTAAGDQCLLRPARVPVGHREFRTDPTQVSGIVNAVSRTSSPGFDSREGTVVFGVYDPATTPTSATDDPASPGSFAVTVRGELYRLPPQFESGSRRIGALPPIGGPLARNGPRPVLEQGSNIVVRSDGSADPASSSLTLTDLRSTELRFGSLPPLQELVRSEPQAQETGQPRWSSPTFSDGVAWEIEDTAVNRRNQNLVFAAGVLLGVGAAALLEGLNTLMANRREG